MEQWSSWVLGTQTIILHLETNMFFSEKLFHLFFVSVNKQGSNIWKRQSSSNLKFPLKLKLSLKFKVSVEVNAFVEFKVSVEVKAFVEFKAFV